MEERRGPAPQKARPQRHVAGESPASGEGVDPTAASAAEEPEEAEGGEQQRIGLSPRHQRVATVLMKLASTARSFLLYDAHNQAIQGFITSLLEALLQTLKAEGQLALDVEPFELRFAGEGVYVNEDRERSLAFKLYRDGVRALTFRDGFDWEELAKLLEILSIRYTGVHQQEDDVVTLLWKANFKHLDIVAVEGFVPEGHEAGEQASAGGGEGASLLPDDIDLPMNTPRRPMHPSWMKVDDAARDALRDEVSAASLPEDCLLLLRRIRALLDEPKERLTVIEFSHLFSEIRDFLLSDENVNSLSRYVALMGALAENEAPSWDAERPTVARELLRSCGDDRAVRRLIHSVPAEEYEARPELIEILDRACPSPVPALLAAHAGETGAGPRAVACDLLVRYGAQSLELLHKHFDKARGHVALDLFKVLVAVGGEAEALFCAHQLSHPEVEVQDEAVRALEGMRGSGLIGRALTEAFRRASASHRSRVLALIAGTGDRRFVPSLEEYLENEAEILAPEEAAEIGRALGELGGRGAAPRWQEWLKPTGLLRKELHGPLALQVAAAVALGEVPGDEADHTLRAALVVAEPEAGAWIGQTLAQRARRARGDAS